jgi:GAF domain-containing protein
MGPQLPTVREPVSDPIGKGPGDLNEVLATAIQLAGADKGTIQRLDENGNVSIVASRGFPTEFLSHFLAVRREINTTCGAALARRMRVFVDNVETSYLFVRTCERNLMREGGIAAAHSTPIIDKSGRLRGVITVHFNKPQEPDTYDPAPVDNLAVGLADRFERLAGHSFRR